jgi:cyclopropane fatty-acyl-phospholipid synthase-like methyltransferase
MRKAKRFTPEREKARYLTHKNDPADAGYIAFVRPLFEALQARLAPGARGLDFGCGAGSALAPLFTGAGHAIANYDPFFFPEPPEGPFDFIAASEVVEHLYEPRREFRRLHDWLKPRGWLGVMTLLITKDTDFANWHYRRDPTHVAFYSSFTFEWIAHEFGFEKIIFSGERIVLLRRA